MKKEKATEKVEKKADIITNGKTDTAVKTINDAPNESKPETTVPKSKPLIVKIEDLVPFKDHPYKVIEDDSMNELAESIKAHGILNPLIIRPLEENDGKYEIVSGHRRFFAAKKLGMKKVPCTVRFIDRDAATVMMVDSNCQRTELLPSEKARAYKMKMDAMSRQGQRTDLVQAESESLTSRPLGAKLRTKRSDEKLAEKSEDSARQIMRYIRLTYLVPELLQFVDDGKIGMRPAVEMSYLDEEVQRDIVDLIDESCGEVFPSHAQTRRIRAQAAEGEISYEEIKAIMEEKKPNQAEKVKIPAEELRKRIGRDMTDEQYIQYLYSAVDYYRKYQQRQRDQGAR